MLDLFKARLKAKIAASKVNLSQQRIDEISARLHKKFPDLTDETEIDAKLDDYNELAPFDETAKNDDRIRNLETKAKPPKQEPKPDEPEDKFAALEAKFSEMQRQVSEFQARESRAKLNENLQAQLAAKKIPAAFAKRFSVDKTEDIEAVLTEAENDYAEIVNLKTTENAGGTEAPKGGNGGGVVKKATPEEIKNIVSKL